jgi:hypothetical protein
MTATLAPEGVKSGLGGRETVGEPASSAAKSISKPKGENRYARGTDKESAAILAARKLHGRPTLSTALGINQSTCWRWENGKVQTGEVDAIKAAVAKIADLPAPEPKGTGTGSKVKQAVALLDTVASRPEGDVVDVDKLVSELRKVLDPQS